MNITTFIKEQNTKTLVDIFNLTQPTPIKKFSDRAAAEKRMTKLMAGNPDYITFYKQFAGKLKADHITIPPIEMPKPAPEPAAAAPVKTKPAPVNKLAKEESTQADQREGRTPKKQKLTPHLNLRCPSCGYYAKSTPAMLSKARLTCPVDPKHGKLLTAEERGETRGPRH